MAAQVASSGRPAAVGRLPAGWRDATVCDFISDDVGQTYAFEFIGTDSIAMIQVNAPRGARLGPYRVERLDPLSRRVRVTHAGSQGDATLPSFVLEGQGDEVRLRFVGRDVGGVLHCQAQHDG